MVDSEHRQLSLNFNGFVPSNLCHHNPLIPTDGIAVGFDGWWSSPFGIENGNGLVLPTGVQALYCVLQASSIGSDCTNSRIGHQQD